MKQGRARIKYSKTGMGLGPQYEDPVDILIKTSMIEFDARYYVFNSTGISYK